MVDLVKGKGISKASSGAGIPIDGLQALNHVDDLVTLSDDTVWLRTGVVEDEFTLYPNAVPQYIQGFFNEKTLSNTTDDYIVFDGTYFYSLNNISSLVTQYDAAFIETGVTFSLSSQIGAYPNNFYFDGAYLCVIKNSAAGTVQRFTTAGVFVDELILGFSTSNIYGITVTASRIWFAGYSGVISEYDLNYVATGVSFDASTQLNQTEAVTELNGNIWVASSNGSIYEYDASNAYAPTGNTITLNQPIYSLHNVGSKAFTLTQGNVVTVYAAHAIGVAEQSFSNSGVPNYVRIK